MTTEIDKNKAASEALRQSADYLRSLPVDGVRTQEAKQFAAQNEAALALLDAETQVQPSRDDLVKVREAVEYAGTLIKFCVKPEKCVTRGNIDAGTDVAKSALQIYKDIQEALTIINRHISGKGE